jgi:hypothetical protein
MSAAVTVRKSAAVAFKVPNKDRARKAITNTLAQVLFSRTPYIQPFMRTP